MRLQFINTIALDVVSGGNIYNQQIIAGLRKKNIEVSYFAIPKENYDVTIVDSLCMPQLEVNNLNPNKPILALIHLLPILDSDTIDYYRQNAFFVATGAPTQKQLEEEWQINSNRISVIRPGIPDIWQPKMQWNSKIETVVMVANLLPNKGFDLLIPLLNSIDYTSLRLLIIGSHTTNSAYANRVVNECKKLNHNIDFDFYSNPTKLHKELCSADLFLSLSSQESFGMALFEALSLGLPCISYATGDVDFLDDYPNIQWVQEYTLNSFKETLNLWLQNSEEYQKYCKLPNVRTRNWLQVQSEFYKELIKLKTNV